MYSLLKISTVLYASRLQFLCFLSDLMLILWGDFSLLCAALN